MERYDCIWSQAYRSRFIKKGRLDEQWYCLLQQPLFIKTTTIFGCLNAADVTANGIVGGIVASPQQNSAIINCANTGNVAAATYPYAGGIAGSNPGVANSPIINCYNTGTVSGGESGGFIGGITAYVGNSNIENCYNAGTVIYRNGGVLIGRAGNTAQIVNYVKNSYGW